MCVVLVALRRLLLAAAGPRGGRRQSPHAVQTAEGCDPDGQRRRCGGSGVRAGVDGLDGAGAWEELERHRRVGEGEAGRDEFGATGAGRGGQAGGSLSLGGGGSEGGERDCWPRKAEEQSGSDPPTAKAKAQVGEAVMTHHHGCSLLLECFRNFRHSQPHVGH